MGTIVYIFLLIIAGILLFWLGYYLFFGPLSPFYPYMPWNKKKVLTGKPGDPQICPICSMKLLRGEMIKTAAFPSPEGSTDRIMHVKGCFSCLENGLPRKCPICKVKMDVEDYLISRMFERRLVKNHVHILGCNQCRKT
jgi:hypothetical protein